MLSDLLTILSLLEVLLGMDFVASLPLVMLDFALPLCMRMFACYGHWLNRAGCRWKAGVTCSGNAISTCINIIIVGSACQWTYMTRLKRINIITTDVFIGIFSCR